MAAIFLVIGIKGPALWIEKKWIKTLSLWMAVIVIAGVFVWEIKTQTKGNDASFSRSAQEPMQFRPLVAKRDNQEPLTLHKLFLDEHFNTVAVIKELSLMPAKMQPIETQAAALYDFDAKVKFLSAYIPASPQTFLACEYFCINHKKIIQRIEDAASPSRGSADPFAAVDAKDMASSGRVFISRESLVI